MRFNRLAILLLLAGCKAAVPTTDLSGSYSEDLSIHRPVMMPQTKDSDSVKQEVITETFVPMEGHIRAELDSISKIALIENKAGKYVDGFVILVYSGNDREVANEALNTMKEQFTHLNPIMSYRQPNFRVKAGRFTDRLEANRIYEEVKRSFDKALLIPEKFLLKYE